MTKSQLKVLKAFVTYWWKTSLNDPQPTIRQIALIAGTSSSSVQSHINALYKQGCLRKLTPGRWSRNYKLTVRGFLAAIKGKKG